MNIGIAGVGKMGAAIAARLMEAGNQMTVWVGAGRSVTVIINDRGPINSKCKVKGALRCPFFRDSSSRGTPSTMLQVILTLNPLTLAR